VSQRTSASRRRVEAALSGSLAIEALTDEESVVFDAELDANIEEGLSSIDHIARRTAEGLASVALDDQGRMIEYRPDGTTVVLDA
jgi:hypothetical protein